MDGQKNLEQIYVVHQLTYLYCLLNVKKIENVESNFVTISSKL
jgi:hypothetical protein